MEYISNKPKLDQCPINSFHSQALEGNPLGITPERGYRIYLPPGYYENHTEQYPTIYFLHGYGMDLKDLMICSKKDLISVYPRFFQLLAPKLFKFIPTFEDFSEFIKTGKFIPFILVQPDGSMGIPNKYQMKGMQGTFIIKGSFYTNSENTGKFGDAIFNDLVDHIDSTYRTIPKKEYRGLLGVSMGGYGVLRAIADYPNIFGAVSALSPVISPFMFRHHRMTIPFLKKIYRRRKAKEMGEKEFLDILDTLDLIFSKENPLIASETTAKKRFLNEQDPLAEKNWRDADILGKIENFSNLYRNTPLYLSVEEKDEFGLANQVRILVEKLKKYNIEPEVDIFTDKFAEQVAPHLIGILNHILSGLEFLISQFKMTSE